MRRFTLFFCAVFLSWIGFAQGTETFSGLSSATGDGNGISNSYQTWTWTGDDGGTWTATDARIDQTLNDEAITIRNGDLESPSLSGGIGDLTLTVKRVFSGGEGDLTVYINGTEVGTIAYDGTEQTHTLSGINVSGDIIIKIETPANSDRIAMDDLTWTAFDDGGGSGGNDQSWMAQIGEGGSSTSFHIPIYYLFDYSYSQAIYTADELQNAGAEAGSIDKIAYLPTSSQSTENWRNWTIYMANTSKNSFDDDEDWVEVTGNMQEVFDGDLPDNVEGGEWMVINLDNDFDWDGTSNIIIAVVDNTDGWGNSPSWSGYDAGSDRGIRVYRDSDPIDVDNPPTDATGNGVESTLPQIKFIHQLPCDNVDAGNIGDDFTICPGHTLTITPTGATTDDAGLEFQWQSSPSGDDDWSDIDGATTATLQMDDGISEPTDFRLLVTCSNSGDTDTSNVVTASINTNPTECYCEPETGSTSWIGSFSTTEGQQNIDNTVDAAGNGYQNFTEDTVTQTQTESVDFEATIEGTFSAGVKIWVDWNQDGNFSEDEVAYSSDSYSATQDGTLTVPMDAEPGRTRMRIGMSVVPSSGPADACAEEATTPSYVSYQDYTFNVIALEECNDVVAGNIGDDFTICPGHTLNLSTDEASEPATGIHYQWQSAPAGTGNWTDIDSATATTTNLSLPDGITEATDFRFIVSCDISQESDTSNVVSVSINDDPTECYCEPETGSSYWIGSFSTTGGQENIDNTVDSAAVGYQNFTEDTVSQIQTQSVDFEATIEGTFSAGVKIWVDWNQDGNFSEDEVAYSSDSYSATQDGTLTVPMDAEPGATRMRVGMSYIPNTGPEDPCAEGSQTDSYLSYQDYTFNVIALEGCSDAVAGTLSGPDSTCAGSSITLTANGASDPATGLTYEWQSAPEGSGDWADLEGATGTSIEIDTGIVAPTDFRLIVSCDAGFADTSNVVSVLLKPGVECYCIPTYTQQPGPCGNLFNDYISKVTLQGENTLLENESTANCGADNENYSDYTSGVPVPELALGSSYTITINTQDDSGDDVAVWIDYNDNGFFEANELLGQTAGDGVGAELEASFTFEVPADAMEGTHRMRVKLNYSTPDIDACGDGTYGETEDYMVNVIEGGGTNCEPPTGLAVDNVTDSTADVTWLPGMDPGDTDGWEVIYGPQGFNPDSTGQSLTVDAPLTTLENLDASTTYDVYVRTICDQDNGVYSDWDGPVPFITLSTPCDTVTNIVVDNITDTTADVTWDEVDGAEGYVVIYGLQGFNPLQGEGSALPPTTPPAEITGLTANTTYDVYVVTVCDLQTGNSSDFAGPVSFTTAAPCDAPTDFDVVDITDTTAQVVWDEVNGAEGYVVIYGESGFTPGSGDGNILQVTNPPATLVDLDPDTDYDVYVVTVCDLQNQITSDPAGPVTFTTTDLGLVNQVFKNFTYYPNPVKGQLTLQAGQQIENVRVYNLLGQRIINVQPNDLQTQINMKNLQSAVYMMRVEINGVTKTFKVVKK